MANSYSYLEAVNTAKEQFDYG